MSPGLPESVSEGVSCIIEHPTRNLLFTGKGGVGKTSMACATALCLADAGRRVLLVSTDPASNLGEALGAELGSTPARIEGAPGLYAMNLDPGAAAMEYRRRLVEPYRGILPEVELASMEEQLSGACTLEVAAFEAFSRLLAEPAQTEGFDHVIFDTAPTGHTLRLLSLPSAWLGFIQQSAGGTSCLGPLAGLEAQERLCRAAVGVLQDPDQTTVVLVLRPEPSAIREADRTRQELLALGLGRQRLVINGVFRAGDAADPIATSFEERCRQALAELPEALGSLPRAEVPLAPGGAVGLAALRALMPGASAFILQGDDEPHPHDLPSDLRSLIDEIATHEAGVVLVMGKGGVGKTTIASAIALCLAERGRRVHLTTTDPAAHVLATLAGALPTGLRVDRIDPRVETERYSDEVMASAGASLDQDARALLAEDLRSPCTEEVAVFRSFAGAVAEAQDRFVVLDTAPTGHTILLLDAALAYHREVSRQSEGRPEAVERLLPRLRDPTWTRVLIVTLPEATPVHEAAQLQEDLRRAGIEPFAWVINQSLAPLAVVDPLLRSRQQSEHRWIAEVVGRLARRCAILPWQLAPPVGAASLRELCAAGTRDSRALKPTPRSQP